MGSNTGQLTAAAARAAVAELASPERAASSQRFFKTGPGEYGEGDVFAGVSVPDLRKLTRQFRGLASAEIDALLGDEIHEHRALALFVLTDNFRRLPPPQRWVAQFRGAVRAGRVNNWDLVDGAAAPILGTHLVETDAGPDELLTWAAEEDLWRRRVGIVAAAAFTRAGDPTAVLAVVPTVLDDRRDLIQKASGWMLREIGDLDRALLEAFLQEHAAAMGRTALSYAVEKLPPDRKKHFRSLR